MDPSVPLNEETLNTPPSTNSVGADIPTSAEVKNIPARPAATDKPGHSFVLIIRMCAKAYGAALFATFTAVPILASALTVALYFSFSSLSPSWYSVVVGALSTYIVWIVATALFWPIATARGSNRHSYYLLASRLGTLKERLGIDELRANPTIEEMEQAAGLDKRDGYNLRALREAHAHCIKLDSYLNDPISSVGLDWMLAIGYINAWNELHYAEEALIEVEPVEKVIHGAMHSKLAIQDSRMSNRDELLDKLIQAVNDLDPAASAYFKEHQPDKSGREIDKLKKTLENDTRTIGQLAQTVKKLDPSAVIDFEPDETGTNPNTSPETQARARLALREVQHALNAFRDSIWEKLVRARNRLLGAMLVTGLFTHFLLCGVLLIGAPGNPHMIIAITAFYLAGALLGLFARFYRESQTTTAVDDYGLSVARLVATPLLSGLAGVGGVLITSLLYYTAFQGGNAGTSAVDALQNAFQFTDPRYLLAAAVFGLTPNLILGSLQQRADKYVSDLRSSKGTEQAALESEN